jgi:hypothetical protein
VQAVEGVGRCVSMGQAEDHAAGVEERQGLRRWKGEGGVYAWGSARRRDSHCRIWRTPVQGSKA